MYKPKVQQFRKQIRRQYLNQYFKKRRKQFTQIVRPQRTLEYQTIERLNKQIHESLLQNKRMVPEKGTIDLNELVTLAKFSQTELGVQCLKKTQIPIMVLPFMTSTYYNRPEQHLATCIFVNITYLKTEKLPTNQFLRNIINIIENTEILEYEQNIDRNYPVSIAELVDTIDNSLLIIYHLMVDFPEVIKFYVEECELVSLLYRMLQSPIASNTIAQPIIDKALKIMTLVNSYFADKKDKRPVRKFMKFYITILENSNQTKFMTMCLANIQGLMKIYCEALNIKSQYGSAYYKSQNNQSFSDTQKQFADIQGQIQKSHFLSRIRTLYPYIQKKKFFTKQLLAILRMLCPGLTLKSLQQHVFKLLQKILDQEYIQQQELSQQQEVRQQCNDTEVYQVVYQILSVWTNNHDSFTKSSLFQKVFNLYSQFEEANSFDSNLGRSFRVNFIYIFGMLTLSGNLNEQQKHLLKISIQRYREANEMSENHCQEDSQFQGFIHIVQNHFQDSNLGKY